MADERGGRIDVLGAVTLIGGIGATLAFFFGWFLPTERRLKEAEDQIAKLASFVSTAKGIPGPKGDSGPPGPPGAKGETGAGGATADPDELQALIARVAKLEAVNKTAIAAPFVATSVASPTIWRPGECFNFERLQDAKIVVTTGTSNEFEICWKDKTQIGKLNFGVTNGIFFTLPSGKQVASKSEQWCLYNEECIAELGDVSFTIIPERLAESNVRLRIENKKN